MNPCRSRPASCLTELLVMLTTAPASFAAFCPDGGTTYAAGNGPIMAQACDLNGDGYPDLLAAIDATDQVSVLLNNQDGTFGAAVLWGAGVEPVDLACCDVNGDGAVDVITANRSPSRISVLLNDGSAQFAPPAPYAVGLAPWSVRCVQLNDDGFPDIVTANFTGDDISVLLNNGTGDGTFAARASLTSGDGAFSVDTCDLDRDQDDDLVVANVLGRTVSVFRNNGDGTLTLLGAFSTGGEFAWAVTCCDVDGDGVPDAVTANGGGDSITVLHNDGTGALANPANFTGVNDPFALACCDIDGDGDADVATANLGDDTISVFENAGNGSFAAPVFASVTDNPGSVTCTDVDRDSTVELATAFGIELGIFRNECGGVCGDGVVNPGEECDDGNLIGQDGCGGACTIEFPGCVAPMALATGPRYITMTPAPGPDPVALHVIGHPTDPAVSCVSLYVQPPEHSCVGGINHRDACAADADCPNGHCTASAVLDAEFVQLTPEQWGTVHIRGAEILPSNVYGAQVECGSTPGLELSPAVVLTTWLWGDVDHSAQCTAGPKAGFPCNRDADCPSGSCGKVNFRDVGATVDAYKGRFGPSLTLDAADLLGCVPNRDANFIDIGGAVNAFKSIAIQCESPCGP